MEREAQSIPPDMAEQVAAQLAMSVAYERYGAPLITYDDFAAKPSWARRTRVRDGYVVQAMMRRTRASKLWSRRRWGRRCSR